MPIPSSLPPAAKRFAAHKLDAAIHSILWEEWDPIGVNGMFGRLIEIDRETGLDIGPPPPEVADLEWPDDEYDGYVWGVLSLLDKGADACKIGDYLDRITTDTIGMPWKDPIAMRARHRELAERILAL